MLTLVVPRLPISMCVFGMTLARELWKPPTQQLRTLVYPLFPLWCTTVTVLLASALLLTRLPILQKLETLPLRNLLTAPRSQWGTSMVIGL